MVRIAIIIALLLAMVVTIKGIATTWMDKSALIVAKPGKAQKAVEPVPPTPPRNPEVPSPLPDLKVGYLFNQERSLVEAPPPSPEEAAVEIVEDKIPGVKLDDVLFVGSVIGDTFKKALISYPPIPVAKAPGPAPRGARGQAAPPSGPRGAGAASAAARSAPGRAPLPGGGGRPTPPTPGRGGGKAMEHMQLVEGDVVNGYKLAGIFTDKLVFAKGTEQVEKKIYDAGKQRAVPVAPPPAANVLPRPDAQGNVPPPPMPITRAITIPEQQANPEVMPTPNPAEGAPPPGAEAGSVAPPAAAVPPAPVAPVPVAQAPPSVPVPPPPTATTAPEPIRRMIITRPSAPLTGPPDTSSVVRGNR